MNCESLCGYKLRRPHLTCLFCRRRRDHYHKTRKGQFTRGDVEIKVQRNPNGHYILPVRGASYLLIIDENRKQKEVKRVLLKHLLTFAELLAN